MSEIPLVVIKKPKILSIVKEENKKINIDIIPQPFDNYFINYDNLEDSFDFHFIYKNVESLNDMSKKTIEKNIKRDIIEKLKQNLGKS